jgi:ABC-type transport system involved in cytochrome bd biosynthesis fused ATPase/permease subunit
MPLPAAIQRAGETAAAARRLFELIDQAPAVLDPAAASAVVPAVTAHALGLRVRDLRFRYAPGQRWIFDGLSFDVRPGGRVALVGPTGVGKSTLVNVLLRFWEYEAGSVELSGEKGPPVELRSLSGETARSLVSVMPQAPHLFHATIRENLAVAWPADEEPGDAALLSVLEAAGCADFVRGLPQGLSTSVGDLGRELSIGEVRRIALARALLKDAPLYILDEPTEGLDESAAEALLWSVTERLRGRTLVVITHRARDLSMAEEVIRLAIDR